jgi:hypothetical protein
MSLSGEMRGIKTNGLSDYTEAKQIFHISGLLRELYYRRVKYAKIKYLSENTLFLSGVDKDNIFSEGSEGYRYVEEYADKKIYIFLKMKILLFNCLSLWRAEKDIV